MRKGKKAQKGSLESGWRYRFRSFLITVLQIHYLSIYIYFILNTVFMMYLRVLRVLYYEYLQSMCIIAVNINKICTK